MDHAHPQTAPSRTSVAPPVFVSSMRRRGRSGLGALLAVALLATSGLALGLPTAAFAEAEAEGGASKSEWQAKYRRLLRNAAIQRRNAEQAVYNYAEANRRNYPRGAAREKLRQDERDAQQALAEIDEEIETLRRDARREGALPGWFYEVEEEPLLTPEPASRADGDDEEDRKGRNPIHFRDDEDDE